MSVTGDPLPFGSLYIHTIYQPSVGITGLDWKNPTRTYAKLDRTRSSVRSEYSKFYDMIGDDAQRPIIPAEEAASSGYITLPSSDDPECDEPPTEQYVSDPGDSTYDDDLDDSMSLSSISSEDSDTYRFGTHPIERCTTTSCLPLVHVTYDLTKVEPVSPNSFYEDHAALTKYVYSPM